MGLERRLARLEKALSAAPPAGGVTEAEVREAFGWVYDHAGTETPHPPEVTRALAGPAWNRVFEHLEAVYGTPKIDSI